MRSQRTRSILPVCLAVLTCMSPARGADAPPVGPEGTLFTGGKNGLWIVRNAPADDDAKGTFTVATRQADGKWRLVARDHGGQAAAAAVIDSQLHLVLRSGGYLTFRRGQNQGQYQRALESGPLAVTPFQHEGKTVLLAVADARVVPGACAGFQKTQATQPAKGAAATRPAVTATSKPAAPTRIIGLLMLVFTENPNSDQPWQPIALLDGVAVAPEGRVLAAVLGRRVYILVANAPAGPNRLIAWQGGEWREVALAGPAADEQALGLCVAGGRLVLVLGERTDKSKPERRGRLVVFGADDTAEPESHLIKAEGGKTARLWPAGSLPVAAGFGEQLAMLWQDGDALKFATCSPVGELETRADVTVFDIADSDGQAEKLYFGLMWGLMLVIFAMTFIRRPRRPMEPFQLPPGARPAQMPRRIIAAAIDLVPFSMVATMAFLSDAIADFQASQATMQEMWDGMQEYENQVIYSHLMWIGLYTAYAGVMELRFGATLGKKLFKLRVVGHAGAVPAPRDIVLRNLVRAIVLFWTLSAQVLMLPLLLVVFPLINRNRQRMGDMLARTAVIDARIEAPTEDSPTPDDRPGDESESASEDENQ